MDADLILAIKIVIPFPIYIFILLFYLFLLLSLSSLSRHFRPYTGEIRLTSVNYAQHVISSVIIHNIKASHRLTLSL